MGLHGQGIQCDSVQFITLDYQRRRGFLITHEGVVGDRTRAENPVASCKTVSVWPNAVFLYLLPT